MSYYIQAIHVAVIGFTFLATSIASASASQMGTCVNRCAEQHCGMTADDKVFYCQRKNPKANEGRVNLTLNDKDKVKLPNCYRLAGSQSIGAPLAIKFLPLKNKVQFDKCLRRCQVELVNWCQP